MTDMALSSWADVPALARRHERQRAFQAARRHSRLVRRLKLILPAAGAFVVLALAVATNLSLPGEIDIGAARLSVTRNSIVMEKPHLTGFDADGREYSVEAVRAEQALTNPDAVRLETIRAKISEPGHGTATIAADSGNYDNAASTLELHGAITVDSSEGYSLRMTGAKADLRGGVMSSENPVSVRYQDSETTGQSLSVSGGGRVIVLDGGVRTILMPPKRAAPGEEPRKP